MSVATDMQTAILASIGEDIGEDLLFRPGVGPTRTIKAIVRRLTSDVNGIARALPARITVVNNATTGILSSAFDAGLDKIDVPPRQGDTAITCESLRILSHSEATITLEAH